MNIPVEKFLCEVLVCRDCSATQTALVGECTKSWGRNIGAIEETFVWLHNESFVLYLRTTETDGFATNWVNRSNLCARRCVNFYKWRHCDGLQPGWNVHTTVIHYTWKQSIRCLVLIEATNWQKPLYHIRASSNCLCTGNFTVIGETEWLFLQWICVRTLQAV